MVKIRELTDRQLVSQLEKYEKIYVQLLRERDKRAKTVGSHKGLLTELEKKEAQEAQVTKNDKDIEKVGETLAQEKTQFFHLKLNDEDLNQIEAQMERESAKNSETENEVHVTRLLQLSEVKPKKQVKKVMKKKVRKK